MPDAAHAVVALERLHQPARRLRGAMPDVLETGSVVAGYRIARLIGRGATGAVYLAADAEGSEVALKVLIPELAQDERFRERFLRESQIAASLDEPHVVPTLAVGEDDGMLYLAMRFVDGLDLREILKREGPLSPERAVDLIGQVAGALDAAHALGLVHRDVKPGNVLVLPTDAGEHAYLCDFGLAKHVSSVNSLTGDRALVGTIAYISPEQIEGGAIDARADVYSLGLHALRVPHGPGAVRARERDRGRLRAHARAAPARERRPAGRSRRLRHRRRDGAREGAGRPLRELRRARRGERGRAARRAAAPQPAGVAASRWAPGRCGRRGRGRRGRHRPQRRRRRGRRAGAATRDRAEDDGPDRRASHEVVGAHPVREPALGRGVRRAPGVGAARRRAPRRARGPRVAQGALVDEAPVLPGAIATGGGGGLGHRGRWAGARASRRDDRADREAVLRPDPGRPRCEPDRHRLRGGLGLGRARARDGARRPRRAGRSCSRIPTPLAATSVVFAERRGLGGERRERTGREDRSRDRTGSRRRRRCTPRSPTSPSATARCGSRSSPTTSSTGSAPTTAACSRRSRPARGRRRCRPATGSGSRTRRAASSSASTPTDSATIAAALRPAAGDPLPRRPPVDIRRRARAGRRDARPGQDAEDPARERRRRKRHADPAVNGGPGLPPARVRDLRLPPQLPRRRGGRGPRAPAEVAAAMPDVSPDGRTYTFRIRPGFRFSPPSGQAVTAETFRPRSSARSRPSSRRAGTRTRSARCFRRRRCHGLRRRQGAAHPRHHGARRHPHDPADARRGRPPRAARARPSFCPVPIGTPAVPGGGTSTPIPMAGPYCVASASGGQVVLERNPNYTGDRPRRIERIVYTIGVKPADAISRVEQRARRLRQRHAPSATTRPGRSRPAARSTPATAWRAGPVARAARATCRARQPGIDGIAFNTQRPLFRDVRMRRAAAYALDRRALAAVFGEQPTDRLIPPAIGGPGGNIAYPDEPDLAAARRLAGPGAAVRRPSTSAAIPRTGASPRSSARTSPRSGSTCASTSRSGA